MPETIATTIIVGMNTFSILFTFDLSCRNGTPGIKSLYTSGDMAIPKTSTKRLIQKIQEKIVRAIFSPSEKFD
ncbi:MAG: hypothetical protein HYV90_05955 [Candidatus Woesebacteria bacterium]|nr:MAG: hypothetical protein HYV90_05955 [Candidatus Woesebacteria bacterium]